MTAPAPAGGPARAFRRILVGHLDSERGADAVALGSGLARVTGADLIVATVVPAVWVEHLGRRTGAAVVHSGARDEAAVALERVVSELAGTPGLDRVERRLEASSSRGFGLHDLAESEDADLIVVGSSHRGALGRATLGTVADRLLHGAPCAVAVAPAGHAQHERRAPQTVGIAFDGSPEAMLALRTAHALAAHAGAGLRVLTVLEPIPPVIQRWIPLPGTQEQEALERGTTLEHQEEAARGAVREAVATLPEDVTIATSVITGGDPARVLVDAATRDEIDLLLVGSRGYGPLRRTVLGSVAVSVLHRATMPVIVVPRGAAAS